MVSEKLKQKQERQQLEKEQIDSAIAEYLENGGKVTKCEPGARTENIITGQWGRKSKKSSTSSDK